MVVSTHDDPEDLSPAMSADRLTEFVARKGVTWWAAQPKHSMIE
jgi:hypothetical protein